MEIRYNPSIFHSRLNNYERYYGPGRHPLAYVL